MTKQEERDAPKKHALPDFAREMRAEIASDFAQVTADTTVDHRPNNIFDRLSWFRDLRLAGKVHFIFGTFFAVGFAMVLVLALGFAELWSRNVATDRVQEAVVASTELRGISGELRYNSVRYIFGSEQATIERQRDSYQAAKAQVALVDGIIAADVPELAGRLKTIHSAIKKYNAIFVQTTDELEANGRSERAVELTYELAAQGDELLESSRQFAIDLSYYADEIQKNGINYFWAMIAIVSGLAFLALLVLLAGSRYLSRHFSSKISEITNGMNALAGGERDFEVTGHGRKDEIGEMANALELFKRANRKMEVWAQERAERAEEHIRMQEERDRTRQEDEARKSKLLEDVARQFESTIGDVVSGVAAASSQLQTTATKMAATAEQSSERTREVSQSMNEANSGATAAAAATDEFALSISEISRQAASSSDLARLATDATVEADTTISELSNSAEEVGQIVELIQSIAQRTNLLALNASIEAARGGEAGRGFAVVASEVKELAMQTSRATEQISDQIRDMQDTTGASVNALRSIAGQVRELETTAVSIASAVDQQSVAGQDLARSIDIAARGTDRVSGHVEDVRELSLSTGAAATQVLTSATELEEQATTLSNQVDEFLRQVREA